MAVFVVACGGGGGSSASTGSGTTAPAITTQPGSQTVTAGQTATFTVAASGTPAPTYQWYRSGAAIQGATSAAYSFATVAGDTGATFYAVASNTAGSATSTTATLTVQPAQGSTGRWVSGYYAGYFWTDFPPELIDMSTMTHVIFARVFPGAGMAGGAPGTIVAGAASAQVGIPGATGIAYRGSPSAEHFFVARAHAAGIKALAMVGGSGDGPGFANSTATPELVSTFARTLVDYMVGRDFDGIDVDWEDGLDPTTFPRVNALLDALRAEANSRPRYQAPNAPVIITFPGYTLSTNSPADYPVAAQWRVDIANRVDQYNLQSYVQAGDYPGWTTWHFAPIHNNANQATHPLDLETSLSAYVAAGVPRAKLGVGIGLFGINYSAWPAWAPSTAYAAGDHRLQGALVYRCAQAGTSAASGGPSGTGTAITDGTARWDYVGAMGPDQSLRTTRGVRASEYEYGYNDIYRWIQSGLGTPQFDPATGSSFIIFPGGQQIPGYPPDGDRLGYLTYEDERSIAAKGQFVRDNGFGGTIVWTINYGVVDSTGRNPAMTAVKNAFLGP